MRPDYDYIPHDFNFYPIIMFFPHNYDLVQQLSF